jgi:rhamnosyltransferase
MQGPPAVHVVLATFNGGGFLREQIESIRSQHATNWTLLVRDDGSTDDTVSILRRLADADPRILILHDDTGRLGPVGGFARLAAEAVARGARYVMFADQDDVWRPDKIETSLRAMRQAESERGATAPLLVHSDLQVIDRDGRLLHPSFMRFQRIRHEPRHALRTLLVQNFVTGCATMVNLPLLDLALPVPDGVLMHDWWFALCAAAAGAIVFVPEATIAYRRHGANAVTARGFWRTMNPFVTGWRAVWQAGRRHHAGALRQAEALLARLQERHRGEADTMALVGAFVALHASRSGLQRVRGAMALGLRSQTAPRTAALYGRLLTGG